MQIHSGIIRRGIACLAFSVLVVIPVFAGGQGEAASPAPGSQVEISFSTWLGLQEVSRDMMEEIVERFHAQNPNIRVNLVGVPFENQLQQTMIAASGRNLPDIIHLVPSWVPPLYEMNALSDLTPLLSQSEFEDIQAGYRDAGTIDGDLVYTPLQNGSIVVLANRDLLRRAGLPEAIPETWDDFKEAVRRISALGDDVYGFGMRTARAGNSAFWFLPILYGHEGTFEDADGNINFNTPGTIDAMEWLSEIGTQNQTPIGMGIPEVRTLFAQGNVGFIFDGPWMKGVMRSITGRGEEVDDEYIVGPMPRNPDGSRFTIANDHVLAISSTSPNKDAAMEFIRFLTMDEEITTFHYENMGAIPGYNSLASNQIYQDDPYIMTFIESAEFASGNPSKNPNFTAALEELASGMQEVLLGGDPAEVTAAVERSMQAVYDQ
jgi:ABC-type glycerol-3-phosphate transport system substrate-binding protein